MVYLRYVLSVGLLILSSTAILYNDIIGPYRAYKFKRHESPIPILGGLLATIGLLLLPINMSWWCILPLFIDIGCVVWIIQLIIFFLFTN